MERLGIRNGADLSPDAAFPPAAFRQGGPLFFALARGIDDRPVRADRVRKSIGAETTFDADLFTAEEARGALEPLIAKVWSYCEDRRSGAGRRRSRPSTPTSSRSPAAGPSMLRRVAGRARRIRVRLLEPLFPVSKGIRLLGMTLSSLDVEQEFRSGQQLLHFSGSK